MASRARLMLCTLVTLCLAARGLSADPARDIATLMSTLHERRQFNGAVLVAQRGRILYRHGFGEGNLQTRSPFTPDTPSDIGSVTKPFTALAVMMLRERRKLSYDDRASKYIPE